MASPLIEMDVNEMISTSICEVFEHSQYIHAKSQHNMQKKSLEAKTSDFPR